MFLYIIGSFLFYITYRFYKYKNVKPIFGIYSQEKQWYPLKYVLFLIIYYVRIGSTKYLRTGSSVKSGFGIDRNLSLIDLDRPQPLSDHIKAFDAVFFIGANPDGYYFAMGSERRQSNVINGLFYLVIPEIGLLCSSKLPDTILFGAKDNLFNAEGIVMTSLEPMRKWKLRYKGYMWSKTDPSRNYTVKFSAEWTSKLKHFNYDTDLHPRAISRAMAREPWTKEYFERVKSGHQSRYEQMGQALVKINIDGEEHEFTTPSFRDHGYGDKRDWSLMHRYAFFHIFLENGMMAAIGVVSQPCTVTSMETGFVQNPDGTIHPVEWCDFQLYQHGEGGRPPKDHGFQFKAGGTVFTTQVQVQYQNTHYVGWDWEAKMVERFVKYTVNGVRGRGVSEFHYRHKNGRPADVSKDDPEWFEILRQHYIYSK